MSFCFLLKCTDVLVQGFRKPWEHKGHAHYDGPTFVKGGAGEMPVTQQGGGHHGH
jgi:hypothetical protein